MPFQALSIARNAFVESLRQPVLMILVLLSGIVQAFNTANTGFAMGMESTTEVKGDDKLLLDIGLASVFVLGTLIAGFIATAVMSREIENKTVLTVVSKPIGRPTLVIGKYLGVSGAILIASLTMLLFLLIAIRHGVMSTSADELDQPVFTFTLSAIFISLGVAAWCNFYYGWNFPQTVVTLLLPLLSIAYVMILLLSKEWKWQELGHDFKPQVAVASGCLVLAILVLTAIATAASTRLGQVMTIATCVGAFAMALLSNSLVGRHVFSNPITGTIKEVRPATLEHPTFLEAGDIFNLTLANTPVEPLRRGDSFYYSPSPSGFPMMMPTFEPADPAAMDANALMGAGAPGRVVVTEAEGRNATIQHTGAQPLALQRAPEPGDYVFTKPTRTNYMALAVWGVVPNLHFFWLLDAVSQNRPVPIEYLVSALGYSLVQIVGFLTIAIMLFQKRDLG